MRLPCFASPYYEKIFSFFPKLPSTLENYLYFSLTLSISRLLISTTSARKSSTTMLPISSSRPIPYTSCITLNTNTTLSSPAVIRYLPQGLRIDSPACPICKFLLSITMGLCNPPKTTSLPLERERRILFSCPMVSSFISMMMFSI